MHREEVEMSTPLALSGMIPVDDAPRTTPGISEWSWKPDVEDPDKISKALLASSQTSRQTWSKQTDYGEGK